jgi:hypothetical protein
VWADEPRTLHRWAMMLSIAPNTLHNWKNYHALPVQIRGTRSLVAAAELRRFAVANPQLSATRSVLRGLESAERAHYAELSVSSGPGAEAVERTDGSSRGELRELRARVATLDSELDKANAELARVRSQEQLWRERARAHRVTIRGQLDLEDAADVVAGD